MSSPQQERLALRADEGEVCVAREPPFPVAVEAGEGKGEQLVDDAVAQRGDLGDLGGDVGAGDFHRAAESR